MGYLVSEAVWLNWAIFEKSSLHIFLQLFRVFWAILKQLFLSKHVLISFWKQLGYFLFQHLVKLVRSDQASYMKKTLRIVM